MMPAPKGHALVRRKYPHHDTSWFEDANCVGQASADYDPFFPVKSERITVGARRVCSACPVIGECLEYALATKPDGVWGGMSAKEREALARRRKAM